jgi:hypothetical protein
VTVTDAGGASAAGSKTVQSTNVAPAFSVMGWQCSGGSFTNPQHDQGCGLLLRVNDDDPDPSHAVAVVAVVANMGCTLYSTGYSASNVAQVNLWIGGLDRYECWVYVTMTDDWGLSTTQSLRSIIQ